MKTRTSKTKESLSLLNAAEHSLGEPITIVPSLSDEHTKNVTLATGSGYATAMKVLPESVKEEIVKGELTKHEDLGLTAPVPKPAAKKTPEKKAPDDKQKALCEKIFAEFKAHYVAHTPLVFGETSPNRQRYAAIVKAETFEEAVKSFEDARDLRGFLRYVTAMKSSKKQPPE